MKKKLKSTFESRQYMLNRITVIKKRADAIREKTPETAKQLDEVVEKIREIIENED